MMFVEMFVCCVIDVSVVLGRFVLLIECSVVLINCVWCIFCILIFGIVIFFVWVGCLWKLRVYWFFIDCLINKKLGLNEVWCFKWGMVVCCECYV